MIDRSTIDRIMAAADIVDVVSDFVTLRRSGANFKGLCPFHDEKTPSFMVSPAKQLCKCFSCGGGGNVVNFVMQHEQMTYPEALKWLGRKYGIEVKERELTDEQKAAASAREAMFVVNEWARDYFVDTLNNSVDGRAIGMAYFRSRGLRDDIIRKFQLGYALNQRDALAGAALKKGFDAKHVERTGLCFRTDDGRLLDRYHGRVIFPVHSVSGRVVAFGGRFLGDAKTANTGKYVNSPESEIYSKKRELYGLYTAKQAIVKHDRCYLVEGYLDVISMYQNGVENVVASSGTSLTQEQVRLIHRFTSNVTVLYDGDAAGIKASLRGIDILLAEGLNIKVLLLPDGEDPDSFAQSHSAQELQTYIEEHQTDFMSFKTDLLMQDAAHDPMKRATVIRDIVRSIAVIPSDIVRQVYIHELSARIGMEESTIVNEVAAEMRKAKATTRSTPSSVASPTEKEGVSPTSVPPSSAVADAPVFDEEGNLVAPPPSAETSGTPLPDAATDVFAAASPALRRLQACERHLMELVVRYGECPMLMMERKAERPLEAASTPTLEEAPTEYVPMPDSPLVAPYIAGELQAEGITLMEELHRAILTEAIEHADEPDFHTATYFPLHSNPEISVLASRLTDERYQLSSMQQEAYVPEEYRLSELVPHVLNDYKYALLALEKEGLLLQLRSPSTQANPEAVLQLMQRLVDLNEMEMSFAKVLGDRVVNR